MTATAASRVRFGLFELDRTSGELFREGVKVKLQEQPLQVLLALVERPGEVVTRDALRERLWRDDTFVDFDHGLNTAIKKVRAALRDSADNPTYIETLARRGYRFIAPVTADAAKTDPVISGATASDGERPLLRRQARIPLVAAAAVVLVLGTAFIWGSARRTPPTNSAPGVGPVRLAVLPLRVLPGPSPSAEDEYLGIGIADAIITRLANLPGIALHPTASVLHYAHGADEAAAAAHALQVDHLLVGTVQRTPDQYRVSIQLVRAADGATTWARSYDVRRADLLGLQDAVGEQVADALPLQLSADGRAPSRHTSNPAAFDAYLRGRARMANYTEAKMRLAITDFEEAVRLDADYALARAALATAFAWFSVRYAYENDARAWGGRAEEQARAALARDPNLGEAHLALANAAGTTFGGFDWRTVMTEADKALALDPTLELAHLARMRAFYHSGLFEQARQAAARARLLNPAPNVEIDRVAVAMRLFAGDYAGTRDSARDLLERTDAPAVRNYLGLALYYLGDAVAARQMLASARRGGQADLRSQASLASVIAASGDAAEARQVLQRVIDSGYMDHHVAYSIAATYAQLDEIDRGLEWLERAATTGFNCQPWFLRDPLLAPLRTAPAFANLLARTRPSQTS